MSVVGDRYAESLFDLAKEENKVTQYLDDIKLVGEVLDSDPQIVQFFNHVLIEEGMIYTPYELTDQQIQDIEKAISQKENKKVTLKVSIDPSLLGGIKVQIANRIYDGTIKNKVEMLKKELLRK